MPARLPIEPYMWMLCYSRALEEPNGIRRLHYRRRDCLYVYRRFWWFGVVWFGRCVPIGVVVNLHVCHGCNLGLQLYVLCRAGKHRVELVC